MPHRLSLVLIAVLLVSACGGKEEADPEPSVPPSHTLVFVDRSSSTGAYPEAEQLFADSLAQIVRQHLDRPGDRLSAFVVHEQTLSKAHRLDLRNNVRAAADKDFADEQALENARFKKDLETYLSTATERLQTFATETAAQDRFAQWTDLWGTLGVASEEFPSPGARNVQARIYYFSDMFESMAGPERRNFDRRPPADRAQAQAWAQSDAKTLPDLMVLRPARLQNAHVRVLLGTLATKPNAQAVKFYWLGLFDALGVERVRYN